MTRDLNASIEDVFRPAFLLELNLDGGDENIWTGAGDLVWGGKTWLGAGEIISFSVVKEGTKFQDDRITMTLSGIAADGMRDIIAEFDENSPTGRGWTLYLAVFSEDAKIQSVDTMSAGDIDSVSYADGETRSVEIILASDAVKFRRSDFYRLDDAMQQSLWAGDLGLEFVTDLNDEINWGSAPPAIIGGGGLGGVPDPRTNRER